MMNLANARTTLAILSVAVATSLGTSSCSDAVPIDRRGGSSGDTGSGGDSGSGGDISSGGDGATGGGGTGGTGGNAGSAGAGVGGNGGSGTSGQKCCGGAGDCVYATAIPDTQAFLGQDTCANQGLKCAPPPQQNSAGAPCQTLENHEGRCTEDCFLQGALREYIPLSNCGAGRRCAPCYNPVDNRPTGLCTDSPQWVLENCGNNRGKCILKADIKDEFEKNAQQSNCPNDRLCVPTELIRNPGHVYTPCSSGPGIPGGCIPEYLGEGYVLLQSTCPPGEKCGPCTRLGGRTGACGL